LYLLQRIESNMSAFLIGEDVLVVGDVYDTSAEEWEEWLNSRNPHHHHHHTKEQVIYHALPTVPEAYEQAPLLQQALDQRAETEWKDLPSPFVTGHGSAAEVKDVAIDGGGRSSGRGVAAVRRGSLKEGRPVTVGAAGDLSPAGSGSCRSSSTVASDESLARHRGAGGQKKAKKTRTSVQVESSNSGIWSQVSGVGRGSAAAAECAEGGRRRGVGWRGIGVAGRGVQ
jgi:hypothetical protein